LIAIALTAGLALIAGALAMRDVAEGALIPPDGAASALRVVMFGIPAACLVLVALLAEANGFGAGRVLRHLGATSYTVYLIHMPLIQILEKGGGADVILFVAPPAIAITAVAVHRWVDLPLTIAVRNLLTGQARPKSSSSRMMSSSSR
jgi:peptidoglycan/LPS O-acetylase OafA/YrhL